MSNALKSFIVAMFSVELWFPQKYTTHREAGTQYLVLLGLGASALHYYTTLLMARVSFYLLRDFLHWL